MNSKNDPKLDSLVRRLQIRILNPLRHLYSWMTALPALCVGLLIAFSYSGEHPSNVFVVYVLESSGEQFLLAVAIVCVAATCQSILAGHNNPKHVASNIAIGFCLVFGFWFAGAYLLGMPFDNTPHQSSPR